MIDAVEPEFRYLKALNSIGETMDKCKCPLSDDQRIILAGALAVLIQEGGGNNAAPGLRDWELQRMGIAPNGGRSAQGYMDSEWPFGRNRKAKGK